MWAIEFTTMRALLTAVIAAIEAAAVALAVFAVIGVPAVLIWWLGFGFAAEPIDLASTVAALWQMTHLVPMQVTVPAQTALALGLAPAALAFTLSLAPLTLTVGTMLLAYRSGARSAGRGGGGAWALVGGIAGFAAAASAVGVLAVDFTVGSQLSRIIVPAAVYAVPMIFGFVLRAAREDHEWWNAVVRRLQVGVSRFAPKGAAALPDRAAEVFRLTAAALAAMLMLGTLGFFVAIVVGYVDIITLSQGLQLDVFGALMLFVVQLAFLPTAWVWTLSWFAGSGFAVGAATSVTPFDTLLGPLPVLPLFGAIPSSWGWVGGLAPVIIVVIGTVLGGLTGGRPLLRRASALVSVVIPVLAAVLAGLVVALACVVASGSIGPGRLETNGPGWWQTGGLIALELAFGMSLGIFARRFDVARLRAIVPAGLLEDSESRTSSFDDMAYMEHDPDLSETIPLSPLVDDFTEESISTPKRALPWQRSRGKKAVGNSSPSLDSLDLGATPSSDEQPTVEIEPLDPHFLVPPVTEPEIASELDTEPEPVSVPESVSAPEPVSEPDTVLEDGPETLPDPEVTDAVDPLLKAFSWDAETPDPAAPTAVRDWRSRMRSRLGRD